MIPIFIQVVLVALQKQLFLPVIFNLILTFLLKKIHASVIYVRRMYYGFQIPKHFSSDWPENVFVDFSYLDYEMTNEKRVCESVAKSKVSAFLNLNRFQSAPNFVSLFVDTVP